MFDSQAWRETCEHSSLGWYWHCVAPDGGGKRKITSPFLSPVTKDLTSLISPRIPQRELTATILALAAFAALVTTKITMNSRARISTVVHTARLSGLSVPAAKLNMYNAFI